MANDDSDNQILAILRSKGLSPMQVLKLAQIAAETETSPSTNIWSMALPYIVTVAAGLIMYNLTVDDPPENTIQPQEIDGEFPFDEDNEDTAAVQNNDDNNTNNAAQIQERTKQSLKDKNQTNEILKAISDIKQDIVALSSYVKEIVSPPIIKGYDIFDKSSRYENLNINNNSGVASNAGVISLSSRLQRLNEALVNIQTLNDRKDILISGSNAALMYISKLKSVPLQTRYKRIYRNNSGFQSCLGALQGHEALLAAAGFVLRDSSGYFEWVWPLSKDNTANNEINSNESLPSFNEAKYIIEQCTCALQRISKQEVNVTIDLSAVPDLKTDDADDAETDASTLGDLALNEDKVLTFQQIFDKVAPGTPSEKKFSQEKQGVAVKPYISTLLS